AAERLYGLQLATRIGPMEGASYDRLFARVLQGQAVSNVEVMRPCASGELRMVRLTLSPIYAAAGHIIGVTELGRDLTESLEAERLIQERTIALRQIEQDLEQFVYVVSHDLSGPLRMVASFTELLQEQSAQLNEDGRTFLKFANDGAKRMQVLLADLLIYSRVGRRPMRAELASLEAALDQALENLMPRFQDSGARLVRSPDPLPTINGDQFQLTQLLQNLISNAIDFCGDSPPRIRVDVLEGATAWTLQVQDQGVGFELSHGERIFEIFQRLNPSEIAGTGVGLAVCRRIAERHRGSIRAHSAPGEGATFEVELPKNSDTSKL
ncbi:MAG: light-regulated signal transduction histidine kinase (bacteriophytochrome), partial [Cognaticolwellia sp.]